MIGELIFILSYSIANLFDYSGKLEENKILFGSRFKGLPKKEQIYTILPMGIDEIYHPRIFASEYKKLLNRLRSQQTLSRYLQQ